MYEASKISSNSLSSNSLDSKKGPALDVWYLHLNRPRFAEGQQQRRYVHTWYTV